MGSLPTNDIERWRAARASGARRPSDAAPRAVVAPHPPPPRPPPRPAAPPVQAARVEDPPVDADTATAITSGSSFELFAASAAIVATIVGLLGFQPLFMLGFATTAVGFALIAQGGAIAARWETARHTAAHERTESFGIGAEIFGGFAAVALGVLALLHFHPAILVPIGALVVGAALLLGGPVQAELAAGTWSDSVRRWRVTRSAVRGSAGVMVIAGAAAIVLALLALLAPGGPAATLLLIAMLTVAVALVWAGASVTARFTQRFA